MQLSGQTSFTFAKKSGKRADISGTYSRIEHVWWEHAHVGFYLLKVWTDTSLAMKKRPRGVETKQLCREIELSQMQYFRHSFKTCKPILRQVLWRNTLAVAWHKVLLGIVSPGLGQSHWCNNMLEHRNFNGAFAIINWLNYDSGLYLISSSPCFLSMPRDCKYILWHMVLFREETSTKEILIDIGNHKCKDWVIEVDE